MIIAVALIRRICPLMRRSLLHKQSRHLFWSFLLLPLRSLLRTYNVDNEVAVATAAATALIVVDVAIFAAVDVSSASAYAVAGSVAVAAAATLDVLFYLYLC